MNTLSQMRMSGAKISSVSAGAMPSQPQARLGRNPLVQVNYGLRTLRTQNRIVQLGKNTRNNCMPIGVSSASNSSNVSISVSDVPFPTDYADLLQQAKEATESAMKDKIQLMEIEFPTSGLLSVPGDREGGTEMTESMLLIREFCDRLVAPEKATRTRIVWTFLEYDMYSSSPGKNW